MPIFSGSCNSNNISQAYNIPSIIKSFSLVNKTSGGITVVVGIKYGSTFDILYNKALASGTEFIYSGKDILLPSLNQIFISVSGGGVVDFYFTILPYQ